MLNYGQVGSSQFAIIAADLAKTISYNIEDYTLLDAVNRFIIEASLSGLREKSILLFKSISLNECKIYQTSEQLKFLVSECSKQGYTTECLIYPVEGAVGYHTNLIIHW